MYTLKSPIQQIMSHTTLTVGGPVMKICLSFGAIFVHLYSLFINYYSLESYYVTIT